MAKKQHCLMCGEVLYEMDRFGAPAGGGEPPLRDDPRYGMLVVCPACDAEHLTMIDDRIPDVPAVRRVRCLKPRE